MPENVAETEHPKQFDKGLIRFNCSPETLQAILPTVYHQRRTDMYDWPQLAAGHTAFKKTTVS